MFIKLLRPVPYCFLLLSITMSSAADAVSVEEMGRTVLTSYDLGGATVTDERISDRGMTRIFDGGGIEGGFLRLRLDLLSSGAEASSVVEYIHNTYPSTASAIEQGAANADEFGLPGNMIAFVTNAAGLLQLGDAAGYKSGHGGTSCELLVGRWYLQLSFNGGINQCVQLLQIAEPRLQSASPPFGIGDYAPVVAVAVLGAFITLLTLGLVRRAIRKRLGNKPSAADRLLQPLDAYTRAELLQQRDAILSVGVISSTIERQASMLAFRDVKAADFLDQYRDAIQVAADRFELTPELVAAVLLSEHRGLETRSAYGWLREKKRDWKDSWKEDALNLVRPLLEKFNISEEIIDGLQGDFKLGGGNDAHIGLGQRSAAEIKEMKVDELVYGEPKSLDELAALMGHNPPEDIKLTSAYLRTLANQAAEYGDRPDIWRSEGMKHFSDKQLGGKRLDLSRFTLSAKYWSPGHISFLAWKYQTGHLNNIKKMIGTPVWGWFNLHSYFDVLEANTFK